MHPLAFPIGPIELIVIMIIGLPVIIGAIVLIVVLTRRKPTPTPTFPAPPTGHPGPPNHHQGPVQGWAPQAPPQQGPPPQQAPPQQGPAGPPDRKTPGY